MSDSEQREREARFDVVAPRWAHLTRRTIMAAARQVSHGQRGVLVVSINLATMDAMMASDTLSAKLDAAWFDLDRYIAGMQQLGTMTPERLQECVTMITTLNPDHEVAVQIEEIEQPGRQSLSTLIIVPDGDRTIRFH
jgi:hypothetical protein